jgi:hypothetical protein
MPRQTMPQHVTHNVRIGQWNMLASNMAQGEFLSSGGEHGLWWNNRKNRVIQTIAEMLQTCAAVVVVENDRPIEILRALRSMDGLKDTMGVAVIDGAPDPITGLLPKPSMSAALALGVRANADLRELYTDPGKLNTTPPTDEDLGRLQMPDARTHYRDAYASTRERVEVDSHKKATIEQKQEESTYTNPMLFALDDTISIYYNPNVLTLVVDGRPGGISNTQLCTNTECNEQHELPLGHRRHYAWKFIHQTTNIPFTIVAAHMSSGNKPGDYAKRADDQRAILDTAHTAGTHGSVPFIVMDSNYGVYSGDYTKLTAEFNLAQFRDSLTEDAAHNKCFKMRHTKGRQPSKFCELIYETIDRILVPIAMNTRDVGKQVATKAFKRFNDDDAWTPEMGDELKAIKDDKTHTMYDNLKQRCTKDEWYDTSNFGTHPDLLDRSMVNIYPNRDSPSDHPPVAVDITMSERDANVALFYYDPDVSPTESARATRV